MTKLKKIISLLLIVVMCVSLMPTSVFAEMGDGNDNTGSGSGASYNPNTGDASVTTGTSSSGTQSATKSQWAITEIEGVFTPTLYTLKYEGKEYPVATYYDIDWTVGTTGYKNSKEEIDSFVAEASRVSGISKDTIWGKGFQINIFAQINARPPHGSYDIYTIKNSYNLLTSNNGDGTGGSTWIASKVRNAASNLGVNNNGWAYYDVPPMGGRGQIVKVFVKAVGINEDGSINYEQVRVESSTAIVDLATQTVSVPESVEIKEGMGYINDVITSDVDLLDFTYQDASKIKWDNKGNGNGKYGPYAPSRPLEIEKGEINSYLIGLVDNFTALLKAITDKNSEQYKQLQSLIKQYNTELSILTANMKSKRKRFRRIAERGSVCENIPKG